MPVLFGAGAAASAGGAAAFLVPDARPARRVAIAGAAAELAAKRALTGTMPPDVARPYHEGAAATLGRAATGLLSVGAVLCAAGRGRRRLLTRLGGLAVVAGAAAERFAVMEAGRASAADPETTIALQRRAAAPAGIDR
jgi:hypothetical protein